jgi:hypothetical protein
MSEPRCQEPDLIESNLLRYILLSIPCVLWFSY